MNLFVRIVLIIVLSVVAQIFLPWYSIVVIAFLVELALGKQDSTAFFSGFYGIAVPWMVLAGYIDMQNDSVLSVRIAELFSLPQYGLVIVIVTGLLGGLVGGIASLSGSWSKAVFVKDNG